MSLTGDNALLHLFRGKSVIVPDHADDRDIDIGKDIDRHGNDRRSAQDGDEEGHNDERIRPVEC
jgi:hypothetical protein